MPQGSYFDDLPMEGQQSAPGGAPMGSYFDDLPMDGGQPQPNAKEQWPGAPVEENTVSGLAEGFLGGVNSGLTGLAGAPVNLVMLV